MRKKNKFEQYGHVNFMLLENIHVYAVLQTCHFLSRHIALYAIHFSRFFLDNTPPKPLKLILINVVLNAIVHPVINKYLFG